MDESLCNSQEIKFIVCFFQAALVLLRYLSSVLSIEFLKLIQVPADLGAKKIIKWIMWMGNVLMVIQVKKELKLYKDDDITNALHKNIAEVFLVK